jgi:hypothetical protein
MVVNRPYIQLLPLLAAAALAGCASKFNHQNFSMIRDGVDRKQDVRELIGDPDQDLGDQWVYKNLDRNCTAIVFFQADGRVVGKEWSDAGGGVWEGFYRDAAPARGESRQRQQPTSPFDD